jgi:hypothetical protein
MTGRFRVRSLSGAEDGGLRVMVRNCCGTGDLTNSQAKEQWSRHSGSAVSDTDVG